MAKSPTEVELDVVSLSEDGLGGATLNERPIWIRNALPGERVIARILKRRGGKKFADGRLMEVAESQVQPNKDRVPSACEYFPRCGGCAMHHMSAEAQLLHKQNHLAEQLARVEVEPGQWRAQCFGAQWLSAQSTHGCAGCWGKCAGWVSRILQQPCCAH